MRGNTTLRFRSDPVIFGAVRRLVSQTVIVAGGSRDDAWELELATGEVLANAYQHAYGKTHGPLQVDLRYDDQMVEISIHDEGGVTGDGPSIPSTLADGSNHRGLYLVGKLTDHAEIVHPGTPQGGTTVRMRKYVNKLRWLTSMLAASQGVR
jgi:anti-sigma regulatory factor (Ser/Thr protein kinase)